MSHPSRPHTLRAAVLLTAMLLAGMLAHPPAIVAQASVPQSPGPGAPAVFYRTVGDGHDRLYRRLLDGGHQPELLAEREAAPDIDDPPGSWFLSPDGSVAIRMEPRRETVDDDVLDGLEAIPLREDAPAWRLARRWLYGEQVSWSSDGRWVGDGRSLIDVATGTTRDVDVPEEWELLGFASDGSGLLYASTDGDGRPTLWRLDPATGDRQDIAWGSTVATGTIGRSGVSPVLGEAITSVDDPDGERRVVVRDLRTGADTVVAGLPPDADPFGYDATGRVALVLDASRDEAGVPPRRDLALYAVGDATARLVWRGPGQLSPETMLTRAGRYLLMHPHYADPALLLVALDGSGATSIPVPGDVGIVDPVGLVLGSMPPSADLALAPPPATDPGSIIDGTPSVLVTSVEVDGQGGYQGRIRVLTPSTGGVVVRAEATVPIPPRTAVDAMGVTAAARPGHRDVLILAGRWERPWVYRWTPGQEPRHVRSLGGFRALWGPVWSLDGRRLVVRVGSSGRRFAVFDGTLRLRRTITLPRAWSGADVIGWTADSRRLVLWPPAVVYADEAPDDPPPCENRMPMATVSATTGELRAHRGTRPLEVLLGLVGWEQAATGERIIQDPYRRGFAFEHGCRVTRTRSEVSLPAGKAFDLRWSPTGISLYVLAGGQRPTQVLVYRRPWADPDQRPRTTELAERVRSLGSAAAGGRWLVVYGEPRLDGRSAGILDRRSGRIHWISDAVYVQGWTETLEE